MSMKYLITYLIAGTRGGETRAKIIQTLKKTPMNMNKLANHLKMDYKTIQYHLRVLEENNIIRIIKKGKYGALYYLSPEMEENYHLLGEIWVKSGKK